MSSPKVFLSYVIENRDSIEQLDRDLTDYGIDVVTDYKYVSGGDNWRNKIRNLIYESGYFIACFSKEFNEREESVAYRELDYAIERASDFPPDRKWIIPVRINECAIPNREIRPGVMLTDLNWTDLFPNTKWDDGVEGIVKALGIELVNRSENVSPTCDISAKSDELVVERIRDDQGMFEDIIARDDIPHRTDLGDIPRYNSTENKNRLYGEQGGNCNGCGYHFEKQHLEIDHIIAGSVGGTDRIENLQLLCAACNSMKGAGTQAQLIERLKEQGVLK